MKFISRPLKLGCDFSPFDLNPSTLFLLEILHRSKGVPFVLFHHVNEQSRKIGIMRGPTLKGDMRVNHAQLIMSAHNKHFVCVFKFYKIQLLDINGSSITRVILAHHRSLSSVLLLTKWFWMYPYFCRYIHFSVVLCTFCLLFQMLSFTGIRYYFTSDFSISPWFVCIRWSNSVVDWSMID